MPELTTKIAAPLAVEAQGIETEEPIEDAVDTAELPAPEVSAPFELGEGALQQRAPLTIEEAAKAAYAELAKELKFKGDFPNWEQISERAKDLYHAATDHVLSGFPPRTRFEEIVSKNLAFPKGTTRRV